MSVFDHPIPVTGGQELLVWYSENLTNDHESDNSGMVFADVYGYFM